VQHQVATAMHGLVDQSDEISIVEALRRLRAGWKLIALSTILAGGIAVAVSFIMTPIYESEVLMSVSSPDEESKGQGLSKLASQFGAGMDLLDFGGSSDQKAEYIATLQSRVLTETYIREQNLLPILFASKWDAAKGEWKSKDPKKQPTIWDGNKLFEKKIREVMADKKSGLVTLSISWKNKEQAARWAADLVARANTYLREKALDTSSRHIDYLNEELKHTSELELQGAIFHLLEGEIKKTMMARGNVEYAFKTIDPAVVPQEAARPKRWLISIFGVLAGFFLGAMIALIRSTHQASGSASRT
jgi:uncharacterized protein involved in exopolysaccharide biosynthesis